MGIMAHMDKDFDMSSVPKFGRGSAIMNFLGLVLVPITLFRMMIKDELRKRDPSPSPLRHDGLSGHKELYQSSILPFDGGLRDAYKNVGFKCSFNDFMLGHISYVMKTYFDTLEKGKYKDLKYVLGVSPVNLRQFP